MVLLVAAESASSPGHLSKYLPLGEEAAEQDPVLQQPCSPWEAPRKPSHHLWEVTWSAWGLLHSPPLPPLPLQSTLMLLVGHKADRKLPD